LPTKDGKNFLQKEKEEDSKHLNAKEFSAKFYESDLGQAILGKLHNEMAKAQSEDIVFKKDLQHKFRNSSIESLKLLIRREMLLWWRDKDHIKVKARVAQGECNFPIWRLSDRISKDR
jgi:hypothetical protein